MRRRARECALQVLYQMDVGRMLVDDGDFPDADLERALSDYWASFRDDVPVDRSMTERLVRGVVRELEFLDAAIATASQNWRLGRMSTVDRSLLRVAAFEILRCPDIPRGASINEALEIARRFSTSESTAFVNGILDQIGRTPDAESEKQQTGDNE